MEPVALSVRHMPMWTHLAPHRRWRRDGRGRAVGLLMAATLVLLNAGCSGHSDDHHAPGAAPSSAVPEAALMTLVVTFSVGPHPTPAALARLGRTHPCRAWDVTPGEYGLSQSVEHIAVGSLEGGLELAALKRTRWVFSVRLVGPRTYAEVPAPDPGFRKPWAGPCAIT
jgi:hypothetical protein